MKGTTFGDPMSNNVTFVCLGTVSNLLFLLRCKNLADIESDVCLSCKRLHDTLRMRVIRNAKRDPNSTKTQLKFLTREELEERVKSNMKDKKLIDITVSRLKKQLSVIQAHCINF